MKKEIIKIHYSSKGSLDLSRYFMKFTWDELPVTLRETFSYKEDYVQRWGRWGSSRWKTFQLETEVHWNLAGEPVVKTFIPSNESLFSGSYEDQTIDRLIQKNTKGTKEEENRYYSWDYVFPKSLEDILSEIKNKVSEEIEAFEWALLEGNTYDLDIQLWMDDRWYPWRR